ncbi:MAG TPA: hypothetical protein VGV07_10610 [Devosia sp.]|jgi:hypothetical protein|uniref:hypothetical protein n=1 Tax=Devosia sp. TaxID=1871048 RepID=UPI002DDD1074|nr:hypothetical protein [Devosia sp.]HEV2515691.1 hypothetical protein [Devosia sp.]
MLPVPATRSSTAFYDTAPLFFHDHPQWNKRDERERNEAAIREHLTCIDALLSRSRPAIAPCRKHRARPSRR